MKKRQKKVRFLALGIHQNFVEMIIHAAARGKYLQFTANKSLSLVAFFVSSQLINALLIISRHRVER